MDKTHYKKLTDARFIGAYDLDKDLLVTIEAVNKETVMGHDGKEKQCVVAKLKGAKKAMILNKTNMKIIEKMYGPFVEDWVGKAVTLYVVHGVKAFGDVVDGIRVKKV